MWPLYPLVRPAIFVETFEHGDSILHYVDELEGHVSIKSGLAHIETRGLLKMLLDVDESFLLWSSAKGDSFYPADCMQQLLEQVRGHKINVDGNVCTVIVTTLVLENWQWKLDPEYNVIQILQNLLFKTDLMEDLVYTIEGLIAP